MIQLISVQPKDVHITLSLGITDMEKLIKCLELAAPIKFNGNDQEETTAVNFLTNDFLPFLEHMVKEYKIDDIS